MKKAYKIISDVANKTPVMKSRTLDAITNAKRVFVKCENFQRTGSFKFRGAWNCIAQMPNREREEGIIAHSSGNFAQAVALVAKILGAKATIVMPENATPSKIEATKAYGAKILFSGPSTEDRARLTQEQIDLNGYKLVHPYDDYHVIYGGGTTALE
ncbi:MAG: pyridoxal-phosphate dependent enzyme, partial [Candidatus Lokiarchaeota archaeon]|nr:pyridoxal-phosphate dependent enzyme [Candidatus Lokiarchaeota archaeon]